MENNDELDKLLLEIGNDGHQIESISSDKKPEQLNISQSMTNTKQISAGDEAKSVIHINNAFDSDDDEDMKNFLEQKYNEYGRTIRFNLKKQNDEQTDRIITKEVEQSLSEKLKSNSNQIHQFPTYNPKSIEKNVGIYTDPIFGIRIIHPLISSKQMQERMTGRIPVPIRSIRKHLECGDLSKDWAVAGVVIKKSAINTSKKGSQYVIWKLSDLHNEIKTISVFLFKNAYNELWKTAQGMVVAILNPGKMDNSKDNIDEACISVSNSQKFMILGQSKDLGTCKSRKKNGDPCNAIVNLGTCEYCVYHVQQEYRKMSGRSELQSPSSGRGLDALRNKVLGKSEVFYGGQSFVAIKAKKNPKMITKDNKRLELLSGQNCDQEELRGYSQPLSYNREVKLESKVANSVDTNASQRIKDIQRLQLLKEMNQKTTVESTQQTPESDVKSKAVTAQKLPMCSQTGYSPQASFSARKSDLLKQKALAILKKKPIDKPNPNFIKHRGTNEGKKRAYEELLDRDANEVKKQKVAAETEKMERIRKVMEAKSSHSDLVVEFENEAEEKYFAKQLKKEAMEEKMLNTFEMDCKAVVCIKCKYTAFSASDRCKTEGHPIKVIDAKKRFFQCADCSNRTVSLDRIPKSSCKNCHGSRWQRSGMIKERIEQIGEHLSIRGDEEMFLGSLKGKANLSLCVPEE